MFEINPAKKKKDKVGKRKRPVSQSSLASSAKFPRSSTDSRDGKAHTSKHRPKNYHGKSDTFPYTFRTDFLDHFETPAKAYRDIAAFLGAIARRVGVAPSKLRIYDPYFCRGSVKTHLGSLGFTNVYNENEDFYKSSRYSQPLYDVVVTNPPYSGRHKERCMEWLRGIEKPWFCLMWNFAASKAWYHGGDKRVAENDWYLQPTDKNRYDFRNPSGKGMKGGSPYMPLWYINTTSLDNNSTHGVPVHSEAAIPPGLKIVKKFDDLAAHGVVRTKKRLNPRHRKKMKRKSNLF